MNDVHGSPGNPAAPAAQDRRASLPKRLGRLFVVALVLAAGGHYAWQRYRFALAYESTDDAFVERRIIQISSRVAGPVTRLYVHDNQPVRAGQVLARIDPTDYEAALARARADVDAALAREQAASAALDMMRVTSSADLDEAKEQLNVARAGEDEEASTLVAAEAERDRADADLRRLREMAVNLVSRQQLDAAIAAARSARAQVAAGEKRLASLRARVAEAQARVQSAQTAPLQVRVTQSRLGQNAAEVERARAALRQAELDLSYTQIVAPADGVVSKKAVEQGAYVQPGQAIVALVGRDAWVVANFKETQLDRIRVGQDVDIHVDAFPDNVFHGRVDSIQAGTGARFSLLPPENATGNYVKVVQRVPVKIVFDPPPQDDILAAGMSVEPDVKVK